jgi:hypothetical protein
MTDDDEKQNGLPGTFKQTSNPNAITDGTDHGKRLESFNKMTTVKFLVNNEPTLL